MATQKSLQDLCGVTAKHNKKFDIEGIAKCLQGGPIPFAPADSWGALLLKVVDIRRKMFDDPNGQEADDLVGYDVEALAEMFMSSWWQHVMRSAASVKLLGWDDSETESKIEDDESWSPSTAWWNTNAVSHSWELCALSANGGMLVALRYHDEGYSFDVYLSVHHAKT